MISGEPKASTAKDADSGRPPPRLAAKVLYVVLLVCTAMTLVLTGLEVALQEDVPGTLGGRGFLILAEQGVRVFLVGLILLYVLHRMVIRYVADAADAMRAGIPFQLADRTLKGADELDRMAMAYNVLRERYEANLAEMEVYKARNSLLVESLPGNIVRHRYDADGRKTLLSIVGAPTKSGGDVTRGRKFTDEEYRNLFHPDDRNLLFDVVPQQLREIGWSEQRFRVIGHDGGWDWYLARERVVEHLDDGGFIADALAVNISAEMKARDALERNERLLRDLIHALPVGVFVIDNNDRVMLYNEAAVGIWGRRPLADAPYWDSGAWSLPDGVPLPEDGPTPSTWVMGDGWESPNACLKRAVGQAVSGVRTRTSRPDGSTVSCLTYPCPLRDDAGATVGAFNVMVDLTEQEEARRKLNLMSFALANITEAVYLADRTGKILWANEATEQIFGFTANDLVNADVVRLSACSAPIVWDSLWRTLAIKGTVVMEHECRHKDGSTFPARIHLNVFTYEDNSYSLCFVSNLTEVKRAEDERRRLEQRLETTRSLEALGQLAGGIAHDFNNLLGAIMGFAGFISEDAEPKSETARNAHRILAAGARGKILTDRILGFSRRKETQKGHFRLGDAVEETRDILGVAIPSSTQLNIEIADDSPTVFGDPQQLAQVILNLAVNANDSLSGQPGVITIAVRPPFLPDKVWDALKSADAATDAIAWAEADGTNYAVYGYPEWHGPMVALIVEDHGCGMDLKVLQNILAPFFTTKEVGKGTGLGMAVVRGIVQTHGGALVIRSRPDHGTNVKIILPVSRTDKRALAPPVESVRSAVSEQLHGVRILLIDDDVDFRDMLSMALARRGAEVVATHRCADLLEIFMENLADWHVLITDQVMPEMRGSDLIRTVKSMRADMPCILCTGYDDRLNSKDCEDSGIDALFNKPVDIERLVVTAKQLLSKEVVP